MPAEADPDDVDGDHITRGRIYSPVNVLRQQIT